MQNNEEIDLIELLVKLVAFIKIKFKLIIATLLIGSSIGVLTFYLQPNNYKYIISGYTPLIEANVIENSITKFYSELKTNKLQFDQENNLGEKTLNQIKSVEIENIDKKNIEIFITTKSEINIDDINLVLEKYIASNTFINKQIAIRKIQLENTLEILDKQIKKLDAIMVPSSNENSIALLCEEKNKCENDLAFLNPLVITNKSIAKNAKYSLLVYLLVGCCSSVILLFIYFVLNKINKMTEAVLVKEYSIPQMRKLA